MKKYFKLLMVALFATLSLTLPSCGDDDDATDNSLVGTWTAVDEGTVITATFNSNGTLALNEVYDGYTDNYTGTWQVNGDLSKGATVVVNMVDVEYPDEPLNLVATVTVKGDVAIWTTIDEDGATTTVFARVK